MTEALLHIAHLATSAGYAAITTLLLSVVMALRPLWQGRWQRIAHVLILAAWFIGSCAIEHAATEIWIGERVAVSTWMAVIALHESVATWVFFGFALYHRGTMIAWGRDYMDRRGEAREFREFWQHMTGGTAYSAEVEGGIEGRFKSVSPGFCTLMQRSRSELLAINFLDLIHADDQAATLAHIERLGRGEPVVNYINRYRMPSGTYKPVMWLSWSRQHEAGMVYYFIARSAAHDLALVEKESVIDAAPVGIFGYDLEKGRYLWVNPAMEAFYGRGAAILTAQPYATWIAPDDKISAVQLSEKRLATAGTAEDPGFDGFEITIFQPDGTLRYGRFRDTRLTNEHAAGQGIGFLFDITADVLAQRREERQRKAAEDAAFFESERRRKAEGGAL